MKIGIDAKKLSKRYTGIAVYLYYMLKYWSEMDKDNQYFLFSNKDFELDFELPSNFKKVIYPSKVGSFGVMFKLPKILDEYGIDVFWGPEHIMPLRKCHGKRVVTIHDLAILINPKWGTKFNAFLQRYFAIPSMRVCDKVIAISDSTARDIAEIAKIESSKIVTIYNADSPYNHEQHDFTEAECRTIREKYKIDAPYFLFVGSIEPRKNIPTIVKSYDAYRSVAQDKAKLVLAGGLGWRYKESLKTIEESPYRDDIIMTGYCSNQEREFLYRNALAFLFPSHYEGAGFPITEALSVGTPVITARNSSLPELGGKCAYYVNDEMDFMGIKDLMVEVAKKTEHERLQDAESNITWARTFSRKKCAQEILALFNEIHNKK